MSERRLWGWLGPDHADPLANAPMAERWLAQLFGLEKLTPTPPVELDTAGVTPSRLDGAMRAALEKALPSGSVSYDPADRAAASLGQSYPDQLQRRAGRVAKPVDGLAMPASHDEAQALLDAAARTGFRVSVSGGASSVTGALDVQSGKPVVACSMLKMNRVLAISQTNHVLTAGPGAFLPDIETALAQKGLTLGHFPQSFHGATLGGSIAANGAGQRSDLYGRIADNLISVRMATPSGEWRSEPFRHAAAGPWLGGLAAGSEGLFGIITEATVRLHERRSQIKDIAWMAPDFGAAMEAARHIAQSEARIAMVRISDAAETGFLGGFRLARAGRSRPAFVERAVLAFKRAPANPCLVIIGMESNHGHSDVDFAVIRRAMKMAGAVLLGEGPGRSWQKSRFEAPHLREALMARGLGVDTYETAANWSALPALHVAVTRALQDAAGKTGVKAAVFCHLSHSYADGACLYFTAAFPRAADEHGQWLTLKKAATDAILANGGALSHHHGMGADHAPWAKQANGEKSLSVLASLARSFDPQGIMATGLHTALPNGG